jgi:hypothetical protein
MELRANAPLGPKGRATMVRYIREGIALAEAAEAAGVSAKTAVKWVRHYRAGETGCSTAAWRRSVPTTPPRPSGSKRSPPRGWCG